MAQTDTSATALLSRESDSGNAKASPLALVAFADLKPRFGIPFTRVHILRLIAEGKFPRARRVSANRVGWLVSEIEEHLRALPPAMPKPATPGARPPRRRSRQVAA